MRVERFALFFPPLIVRKKVGETEYAIGAIPLGGYVKITGMNPEEDLPDEVRTRAYYAQPPWKRIVVIAAGPAMNFLVALVLLFVFFWQVGPVTDRPEVGEVERGLPAAQVLEPGDLVVAVDGKRGDRATFFEEIAKHDCPGAERPGCRAAEPVTLTIRRDGGETTVPVTPVYDGELRRMRLGFRYTTDREPLPFTTAADTSVDQFWFITRETAKLPARILDSERRKEISGVVGSYETTRQTILDNFEDVVGILALISLSLAVVNLFPFLPLDGGHIFWAVVEILRRGKPVPMHVMERSSFVGFAIVLMLFMIGLTNDIDRLQGEGFDVR
jgi:regulator of sigma E protease